MKSSFILHFEQALIFDAMSDAQAGQLIKRIFQHAVSGESDDCDDPAVKFSMISIRARMDADSAHYLQTCKKRSEAGKLGGRGNTKANAFSESKSFFDKANENKQKQKKPSDIDIDFDLDSSNAFKSTPESLRDPLAVEQPKPAKQPKPKRTYMDHRPTACPPAKWKQLFAYSWRFHKDRAKVFGARAPFTVKKVLDGAKTLDNMTRVRGISSGQIIAAMDWVVGDSFWNEQVRALSSLTNISRNGNTKYANILTAMAKDLVP